MSSPRIPPGCIIPCTFHREHALREQLWLTDLKTMPFVCADPRNLSLIFEENVRHLLIKPDTDFRQTFHNVIKLTKEFGDSNNSSRYASTRSMERLPARMLTLMAVCALLFDMMRATEAILHAKAGLYDKKISQTVLMESIALVFNCEYILAFCHLIGTDMMNSLDTPGAEHIVSYPAGPIAILEYRRRLHEVLGTIGDHKFVDYLKGVQFLGALAEEHVTVPAWLAYNSMLLGRIHIWRSVVAFEALPIRRAVVRQLQEKTPRDILAAGYRIPISMHGIANVCPFASMQQPRYCPWDPRTCKARNEGEDFCDHYQWPPSVYD